LAAALRWKHIGRRAHPHGGFAAAHGNRCDAADFRFLNANTDLILPQRFDRNKLFLGNFSYQGIARLKSGVTLRQANADVARMIGIWLKAWPPPPGFNS